MFYGDYSYELAKGRMEDAIEAHEHHRLVKQLRLARKGPGPRKGIAAWAATSLGRSRAWQTS